MVRIAGTQLLTIVEDVLAFAETLTETDGRKIIEADICEIVRSLARGRERAIWERGVRLRIEMPSFACVVPTDPDIISRAIDALLSNAVKYSAPESTITIRVSDAEDTVRVLVEDTGSGIRAHALPALDDFYHGEVPESTGSAGVGLGLRIVLAAVDALEAELEMSTDPDVGTAVTLVLSRTR
jgi:signal transduction histidine kinase